MAQISNNRTQIINKLMRRFNLSQQQLIAVVAVVVLAIVSAVVLIGIISLEHQSLLIDHIIKQTLRKE